MNEELPTARIGCCPVSSFCILPSSFAYRGHRPAQFHRAAGGNRQRCKPPNGFQQSQIIRRIHLHHRRVNQACAREQTHFGRTLDDVIIGNQITIVRDETPCRCGLFIAATEQCDKSVADCSLCSDQLKSMANRFRPKSRRETTALNSSSIAPRNSRRMRCRN